MQKVALEDKELYFLWALKEEAMDNAAHKVYFGGVKPCSLSLTRDLRNG